MISLPFNKSDRSMLMLAATTLSLGLVAPTVAQAQTRVSSLNPCPGMYYEAPLNQRFLSPEGCPENAARQAMSRGAMGSQAMGSQAMGSQAVTIQPESALIPSTGAGAVVMPPVGREMTTEAALMAPPTSAGMTAASQPPLPEMRDQLLARVMPMNQQMTVKLMNQTNAPVTYEVIGQTGSRTLMGGESVVLRGLSLPSTVSAIRQDNGMLDFKAMASEPGMLEVMMSVDTMMDDNQGVLRIQEDGEVYIN